MIINIYCRASKKLVGGVTNILLNKRNYSDKMSASTIYEFSAKLLTGEEISLSKYMGKVILIENVASL
ncbi:hypothetical protein CHUAL_004097 [Chamberlinius hualienensis]